MLERLIAALLTALVGQIPTFVRWWGDLQASRAAEGDKAAKDLRNDQAIADATTPKTPPAP